MARKNTTEDAEPLYRVTLTANQMRLVLEAVNMRFRTGIKQDEDLAEWLASQGGQLVYRSADAGRTFDQYLELRDFTTAVLDGLIKACFSWDSGRSEDVCNLETIYHALRHQEWIDAGRNRNDVRAAEPIRYGKDPVPKIEKL